MLNKTQLQVWRGSNYKPNVFIGGLGFSLLQSPSDFLELSPNSNPPLITDIRKIKSFDIDTYGNVEFYIPYNFFIDAIYPYRYSNITYFIDSEDILTKGNGTRFLSRCSNLKYFKGEGVIINTLSTGQSLDRPYSLRYFNAHTNQVNSLNTVYYSGVCELAYSLREIKMPLVFNLYSYYGRDLFTKLNSLKRGYFPLLKDSSIYELLMNKTFTCNNNAKFYLSPEMKIKDRNSYVSLVMPKYNPGFVFTINGLTYTCVEGAASNESEFSYIDGNHNNVNRSLCNAITQDTRVGDFGKLIAENSNQIVVIIQTGNLGATGDNTTYIDPNNDITKTLKHGYDAHPLVVELVRQGNTVIYKDDYTLPTTPTNLSYSNLTSNSIDINFTPSTPNVNGNDGFEVWIDCGLPWQKHFKYGEVSVSGETIDLTELLDDGGTLSQLKIKIREIDGQFNLSEFTEEITLP